MDFRRFTPWSSRSWTANDDNDLWDAFLLGFPKLEVDDDDDDEEDVVGEKDNEAEEEDTAEIKVTWEALFCMLICVSIVREKL